DHGQLGGGDRPRPHGQAEHEVARILPPLLPVELHRRPDRPKGQESRGRPVDAHAEFGGPNARTGIQKVGPHDEDGGEKERIPAVPPRLLDKLLPPHHAYSSSKSSRIDMPRSSRSDSASPDSATRPSFKKSTSSKSDSVSTTSWVDMTIVWLPIRYSETIA